MAAADKRQMRPFNLPSYHNIFIINALSKQLVFCSVYRLPIKNMQK